MKNLIPILFILFLASCEDVIDIDLNSIEPRLVVEGSINDQNSEPSIKLTKSGDYFEPGEYVKVSEALVEITEQSGRTIPFEETEPGVYKAENLLGIENSTYSLTISSEGKEYHATVQMPEKVEIKELSYQETPEYMEFTGGYLINCILDDPIDIENFYRLKVHAINERSEGGKNINVFNDDFVDGNEIMMQWDKQQFFLNDTIVVELQTLDQSTYDYFLTLSSLSESDFIGSSNPSNPISNLSNNALGYFGAYTISRDTIVIH